MSTEINAWYPANNYSGYYGKNQCMPESFEKQPTIAPSAQKTRLVPYKTETTIDSIIFGLFNFGGGGCPGLMVEMATEQPQFRNVGEGDGGEVSVDGGSGTSSSGASTSEETSSSARTSASASNGSTSASGASSSASGTSLGSSNATSGETSSTGADSSSATSNGSTSASGASSSASGTSLGSSNATSGETSSTGADSSSATSGGSSSSSAGTSASASNGSTSASSGVSNATSEPISSSGASSAEVSSSAEASSSSVGASSSEPDAGPYTPHVFVETDFTAGVKVNTENAHCQGELMLKKIVTEEWKACDGGMPPWPLVNPNDGGVVTQTNFNGEPCVMMDTNPNNDQGTDSKLYYSIENPDAGVPGFHVIGGSVKGVVSWRAKLVQPEANPFYGTEASVEVSNSQKLMRVGLTSTSIEEPFAGLSSPLLPPDSPMDVMHTFMLEFNASHQQVIVDEDRNTLYVSGNNTTNNPPNYIYFGDNGANTDGKICFSQLGYYNGGDRILHETPGSYTQMIDLLDYNNNLASGATLECVYSMPINTNVVIQTRSCDSSAAMPPRCEPQYLYNCSPSYFSLGPNGEIGCMPKQCLEITISMSTSDNTTSPKVINCTLTWRTYP